MLTHISASRDYFHPEFSLLALFNLIFFWRKSIMKSKVFTLRSNQLIAGLLAFIALAVVGYAFVWPALVRASEPTPAEIAASTGAEAFLSIDHQKERLAWERALCRVSTEDACKVFSGDLGLMVWGAAERNKTRQSCRATGASHKDTTETRQIWLVSLECRDLATGEVTSGQLLSSVTQVEGGWLFERPLFSEEVRDVD
jgi:hypothetical protein